MDIEQGKSVSIQNINISSFTKEDKNSFIQIHGENLFSKSEFSNIYLAERFNYLLQNEDSVTISAKNSAGKMLGLVYGGPEGYKNKMNKQIMKRIVWKLLRKPHLLLSGEFIYKYKSIFRRLITKFTLRNADKNQFTSSLKTRNQPPIPILRLTGIATLEERLHSGIGEQLLVAYETVAKERNYKSIILETPETNVRAIKFYEKFGWQKYISESENMGKVYFYKLILENA